MKKKEASARIKINRLLEEAGWRFFDDENGPANIQLEPNVKMSKADLTGLGENFDKVKPYLELMGSDIYYMGVSGNGQMTKMINNCIYDINVAAFCELMTVAVKLGLEPEQIGKVINTGTAQSGASKFFIPQILEGNFDYGFTIDDAYKDIVSCVEITSLKGLPVPILDAMNSIYKTSMLKGYGDKYKGALVCVYEDLMGVKCRKHGFECK